MAEENVEQTEQPQSKRPSALGNIVMTLVVALVASAGGGFLSYFLISRTMVTAQAHGASKEDQRKEAVADALEKGAAVPLDPFIVNLADSDAARYLRIKISLMVDDKTNVKELTDNQALTLKVRDVILQTLTQRTSQELVTEEGKNKLRQEIQSKITDYFRKPKLVDVMFTDFVIQL